MSGSGADFEVLDDAVYTKTRRTLLREKGSDAQREFLEAACESTKFLDYFTEIPRMGATRAAVAADPLTENEYKDPPSDTEHALFLMWSALTPAAASRSAFWANLTLTHIREGRIESAYLACNGGNLSGGAERIDAALADSSQQAPKLMDSCVRTVLRRLGGLPEVRGNRSVFVDCPFARAWWRERIVAQASRGDEECAARIRAVVRLSQDYWEKFVDRIVFRNSTFGSDNIRGSFLRALACFLDKTEKTKLRSSKGLRRLCRRTTALQGALELGVLRDDDLDQIMEDAVERAS